MRSFDYIRNFREHMYLSENNILEQILYELKDLTLDKDNYRINVIAPESPFFLDKNTYKVIFESNTPGYIIGCYGYFSTNDIDCYIILNDKHKIVGNPKTLLDLSLIFPNPSTFWLSKYDDINNEYIVFYTPSPHIKYYKNIKFIIKTNENPSEVFYTFVFYEKVIK